MADNFCKYGRPHEIYHMGSLACRHCGETYWKRCFDEGEGNAFSSINHNVARLGKWELNNYLESMRTEGSPSAILVLMANGDLTCYTILTSMLQQGHHRVLHFKSSTDALKALQEEKAIPDLVLMDVEMPDMSRLELLKRVKKEFQLPATLMAADENEEIVLGGLDHGLSLYFAKSLSHYSVQSLWQKVLGKDGSNLYPKQRFIWTTELHKKFLDAIKQLEHERVLPQKILELMNVPGLTRLVVASHLQKYMKNIQREKQMRLLPWRPKYSFTSSIPSSSSGSDRVYQSSTSTKSWPYTRMRNLGNKLSFSGSNQGIDQLRHLKIASSAYQISKSYNNRSNLGTGRSTTSFTEVPLTGHQGDFRKAGDYYSGIKNVWLLGNPNVVRRNRASYIGRSYCNNISDYYPLTSSNSFPQGRSALPPSLPTTWPLEQNSDHFLALSRLMESDDIPLQPDTDKLNALYADFSKLIQDQPMNSDHLFGPQLPDGE
ncbi:hypothetical protein COLO4_06966 [Corchorus olitorius]|uniref:Response regulatory domain-containing protein n=1 Tax=Corchorus olitorius TaxID=93759 RepID=A0A1R3KLL2_9ROSI|nr:hypothetical protein COLO4_06966 [Corchorus olitorius]